jgi:fructose-1,6-bisphosphatase/inositol monophosphatase family enzyme
VTHPANPFEHSERSVDALPSPWREVFLTSREALSFAIRHLRSRSASTIRRVQNVAGAGASRTIDLDVERFVVGQLKRHGFLVLSEESEYSSVRSPKYFAILDPIDGTGMAIRGMEYYAVSIACGKLDSGHIFLENTEFSAVCSPSGSFYALRGKGSFFNERPIHTSHVHNIRHAILRLPQKMPLPQSHLRRADSFIFLGSTSLEMCLVARGVCRDKKKKDF